MPRLLIPWWAQLFVGAIKNIVQQSIWCSRDGLTDWRHRQGCAVGLFHLWWDISTGPVWCEFQSFHRWPNVHIHIAVCTNLSSVTCTILHCGGYDVNHNFPRRGNTTLASSILLLIPTALWNPWKKSLLLSYLCINPYWSTATATTWTDHCCVRRRITAWSGRSPNAKLHCLVMIRLHRVPCSSTGASRSERQSNQRELSIVRWTLGGSNLRQSSISRRRHVACGGEQKAAGWPLINHTQYVS